MAASPFRIRWLLIFWTFVMGAIAYLDRVNISIAGQAIARDFRLSDVQLGWVFSAFIIGYALFQAPGGWLADHFGSRAVLAIAAVWWAIFTSLITVVSPKLVVPVLVLILIRFVLGLGEAVVYPASNCIVAAWIPSAERGLANGLIFAGTGFGAGIAPPLVTFFLLHYGWRASFWASSALGLLAGLVWFLIARNQPAQHPWISREELTYIQREIPQAASRAERAVPLDWGAILRNRNLMAITFSYFCYGYEAYLFFSWFFIYLNKTRGLDLKQSAYYSMLPFWAMAVGSAKGGWVSDIITRARGKRAGRCYFSAVVTGASAIFLILGVHAHTARLASVVLAGGAGALYLSQSCYWSMSADIGKRFAGSVSGLMNMGGQIGGAITASLTPWIAHRFGWTASFLVAAALAAAGALTWLFVHPPRDE